MRSLGVDFAEVVLASGEDLMVGCGVTYDAESSGRGVVAGVAEALERHDAEKLLGEDCGEGMRWSSYLDVVGETKALYPKGSPKSCFVRGRGHKETRTMRFFPFSSPTCENGFWAEFWSKPTKRGESQRLSSEILRF